MAQSHKFRKAKSLFTTTLSAGISTGTGETITPNSVSGLPTDTEITLTVDRVDASGTATPTKMERITGVISAGNLTAYTRGIDGSTEQAHSSGAVVEYIWNADDLNDLVDGILVQHNQAGGHGTLTASSVTAASTVTSSSIVASAITASSIVVSTTVSLPNATPTGDGYIGFDRTNEDLAVGDSSASQKVHMGVFKTWVPVFVGFSADPATPTCHYTLVGKMCFCWVATGNGTSNATNFTITGPLTSYSGVAQLGYGQGTDAGAYAPHVLASIASNSTTITLATGGGATGWTNSGNKGANFFLIYEVA